MSAAVALLNRPSQTKESGDEMVAELRRIKIQLTHLISNSLAVSAGAFVFLVQKDARAVEESDLRQIEDKKLEPGQNNENSR